MVAQKVHRRKRPSLAAVLVPGARSAAHMIRGVGGRSQPQPVTAPTIFSTVMPKCR